MLKETILAAQTYDWMETTRRNAQDLTFETTNQCTDFSYFSYSKAQRAYHRPEWEIKRENIKTVSKLGNRNNH